jgi:hypothetical protein
MIYTIADDELKSRSLDDIKELEERTVSENKKCYINNVWSKVPSDPQPRLAVIRDEAITNSLLCCEPSIEKVSVPHYQALKNGPVVYEITASNNKCRWNVWHRFQTFQLLHEMLKVSIDEERLKCKLPIIPFRHIKLVINHKSKDFCEGRKVLLDNYLKTLLSIKELRDSTVLIGFLSRSDESLSDEKVSQEETKDYETNKVKNILVTDESDDITNVSIPSSRVVGNEYVLYTVSVHNMNVETEYSHWNVLHRYSEFKEYDRALREYLAKDKPHLISEIPQLPMKESKIFRNHFGHDFVERRRLLLDSYIKRLIKVQSLRRHPLTIKFLGVRE